MLNPGNGLSPLLPLIFVGAGGTLWLISNLRRLRLLEEFPAHYVYVDGKSLSKIEKAQHRIRELLLPFPLPARTMAYPALSSASLLLFLHIQADACAGRATFRQFFGHLRLAYIALSLRFGAFGLWWSTRTCFAG
jgi:hypothetical protein